MAAGVAHVEDAAERVLGLAQQEKDLYFRPVEYAGSDFAMVVQDLVENVAAERRVAGDLLDFTRQPLQVEATEIR